VLVIMPVEPTSADPSGSGWGRTTQDPTSWTRLTCSAYSESGLGLSQAELAKAEGPNVRQIACYRAGEQQLALSVAVAISNALGISLNRHVGQASRGTWWAVWQT
jgi:hypothetical protein